MGHSGVLLSLCALYTVGFASLGDNSLDGGERVVLVAPVLAPPRDSRTHVTDRSRQFPILILLAHSNPENVRLEPEAKSLKEDPVPIYVKKLEDQEHPGGYLNREKRHLHKILGGGGGYGNGGSTKTIIIVKEHGHQSHHGEGYSNGGGGYGGGSGGGFGGGSGGGSGGGFGGGSGGGSGGGYGGGFGGGFGGGYGGGSGGGGGGGGGGGSGGGYGGSGGHNGGGYGGSSASATATATATANAGSYGKRK